MGRTIFIYGAVIAVAAVALQWLEYKYLTRVFATEFYIFLLALGFTALGVWVGSRLTARRAPAALARIATRSLAATQTRRACR